MKIELVSARDPVFNSNGTITLICRFSHLGDLEIPFTANLADPMEHGRTIYARALKGEFGEVTPYKEPSAQEASDKQKNTRMQNAIRQVQHYEMLGNADMIAQWKAYYADVYNGVIDPVEPAE